MAMKPVIIESKKEITIANGTAIYQFYDGSSYTTITTSGIKTWSLSDALNIMTGDTGWGESDRTLREFNQFYGISTNSWLKILYQPLAEMLGFPFNVQVDEVNNTITATHWGFSRLLIQGSLHEDGKTESVCETASEESIDFKKDVVILKGFNPVTNYDKSNDKSSYKLTSKWLDTIKKGWVKDFIDYNAKGVSEEVNIYGIEHKIENTETMAINLKSYDGVIAQEPVKNLVEFSISIMEAE